MQIMSNGFFETCTPRSYNNEGNLGDRRTGGTYLPGLNACNALLEEWRAKGDLEGLELDRPV